MMELNEKSEAFTLLVWSKSTELQDKSGYKQFPLVLLNVFQLYTGVKVLASTTPNLRCFIFSPPASRLTSFKANDLF